MYISILECFKINEVILNQVNSEIACDHMFIFFSFLLRPSPSSDFQQ
jgi:hypothetical protein